MARIPQHEIDRLQREVSVQRLADARGVKLKRSGREWMGLCPFHKDTDPSLRINPAKNVWHCLGACNQGGGPIEWVMYAEGVSFRHAVEMLLEEHLPSATRHGEPPKKCTVPKLPVVIERDATDRQLLLTVTGYYTETLRKSPEAQKYLQARGLINAEMIEHFHLGFANRTLGYHLPARTRIAGAETRERLIRLGIYRESGHEHFSGSLVIPILNLNGEVTQMYGRKVTRLTALRDGTPAHLYLPGPHRGVWNEQALIASKEIILCEALIDALTFWCAGFRHVTTSYGVNGFTEELRAAFTKYGTRRIYIAYDRDEAGEKAAQAHAAELIEMGIDCFRVQFPKNMDANEWALKTQPAAKALGVMLNRAEWLGKGKRPAVAVIEPAKEIETPQPGPQIEEHGSNEISKAPATEEKPEAAAKEKNVIAVPVEPTTIRAEKVFSLVAGPETVPQEEAESAPIPMPLPSQVSSTIEVPTEIRPNGVVVIRQRERRYEVRGLKKNTSHEGLKVIVTVSGSNLRGDPGEHTDTVDFYAARHRAAFTKQAAEELGVKEDVIRGELGRVKLKLEELRDREIDKTLNQDKPPEVTVMTEAEQAAALELLRDPRLMERILEDFEKCGVVGEETNKKVSYLAAVSRLLPKPLAIVVQSSSAAGKSSLMEAVLALMPQEQREEYSAMTGQALFYMGEKNLKHKILAVSEEEGTQRATYPLKLLQSEGKLNIASTGKDPVSGKHVTQDYSVEGPVMIFLTTTATDVDEELMNRAIVLTVNEGQEQTRAIHQKQREAQTIEGMWAEDDREEVIKVHRNAQRLLRPLRVANEHIKNHTFPDYMTRTRRDHTKFLTLINAIALLHQHQREIKTSTRKGKTREYIEATLEDVQLAEQLVREVLAPNLDELHEQTRRLLALIDQMVKWECEQFGIERSEYRFSRATVRQFTRWSDSQLKRHLHRLEDLEYLIVHRGGRGQSFVYELHFELDPSGKPVLPRLSYDTKGVRGNGVEVRPWQQEVRPKSGPSLGVSGVVQGEESPATTRVNGHFHEESEKNASPVSGNEKRVVPPTKPNGAAKPNGKGKVK